MWSSILPTADQVATDPLSDRSSFGSCVCDLTFLACDFNCRCDTDCSAAEVALFSGSDDEGPRPSVVRRCFDPEVVEVNERGGLTSSLVDNMLCVEKENNDAREYFSAVPDPSAAELSAQLAERTYSFAPSLAAAAALGASYAVDDPVGGGADGGGGTIAPAFGGFFPLPTAGYGGECSDRNSPLFLRDDETECTRYAADLAASCADAFSFARYVDELRVKASPSSPISTPASWVTPTVAASYRRTADGSLTAAAYATLATSYAAGVCSDALRSLHYDVEFDEAGTVTAVAATMVVADVAESSSGAGRAGQRFSVAFVPAAPSTLERPKGGAPGYVQGALVPAGTLVSDADKTAIEQCVGGAAVLPALGGAPGGGACDAAGEAQRLAFGVDALLSCTLELDLAALTTECADPALVRAALTGGGWTHVAAWGGADFATAADWVEVDSLATLPAEVTSAWDADARSCVLSNTLHLELLTADTGAKENPQRRVVAARASLSSEGGAWTHEGDAADALQYPVYVAVTYVHVPDQGLETYTPSAPPVLPRLPRDVLYPLYTND